MKKKNVKYQNLENEKGNNIEAQKDIKNENLENGNNLEA